MDTTNHLTKIAIVGAGGNLGRHITAALLDTGIHTVTAITRADSTSQIHPSVTKAIIDCNDQQTIVSTLRGHDALIITLSGHSAIEELEMKLVNAAEEAVVPWVLRNEWGPDTANEDLVRDVTVFQPKAANLKLIAQHTKISYIAICTGFWYEWSLAVPSAFGFDIKNRTVMFLDDGETKICVSTWEGIGRTVAALLCLPVSQANSETRSSNHDSKDNTTNHNATISPDTNTNTIHQTQPHLNLYKNSTLYTTTYTLSQKDILASVLRVTGTQTSDWSVTSEPSYDRWKTGIEQSQNGERIGFAKMMYSRVFFPDGVGEFRGRRIVNEELGLGVQGQGKEDLDLATGRAVARAKGTQWV